MKAIAPVEAKPPDRLDDRIHIFLLFLLGIGIIKTQMACAVIIMGEAEIQANAFGMADMKIAIWLGGKAGLHPAIPFAGAVVFFDDAADKVGSGGWAAHCWLMFQVILQDIIAMILIWCRATLL